MIFVWIHKTFLSTCVCGGHGVDVLFVALAWVLKQLAVKPANSKRYHDACKKSGVPTKLVLVEGGIHGPAILNGKPAIRKTKDVYADLMIEWINDLPHHE